jgi:hypothetical protein
VSNSVPISRREWLVTAGLAGTAAMVSRSEAVENPGRWRVDPGEVWTPKFEGWGTSLAWWARVAGEFPEEVQTDLMGKIFGSADGLRLNIVRYNIGGGENPAHGFLSYRAAVEGYVSKEGVWNWNADAGQRKVLLKARELGADFFEAFSNSPPWWMTRSGSVTGDKDGAGNLRDEMIGPFTEYLATVVRHFRDKAGLEFHTLAPLNEPLGDWWKLGNKQEGCVIQPAQQSKLITATRAALDRMGLRTLVTGPEDNRTSQAIRSLSSYSNAAWDALGHVNTHTYHAEDRGALLRLAEKHGKAVWMSEYGDGDRSGMALARTILADLRDLRARAWVYWQAVDAYGWGLIEHPAFDNRKKPPTAEEIPRYSASAKFHVMRQFTKHLRPGCRIVSSSEPGTIAGMDPRTRTLSLIALNDGKEPKRLMLELPGEMLRGKTLAGILLRDSRSEPVPPVTCEAATQEIIIPPSTLAALTITGG